MKLKLHKLFFPAFVLLVFAFQKTSFGQGTKAQIVFGATATYMNINGGTSGTPIYLVLGNDLPTAIVPSAGGMISEGEFNYVKWNVGATTGTNYQIPWKDNVTLTEDAQVKFDITVAGNAGGFFLASTYDGASWDNNTYKPTPVANMNNGAANNSAYVIDRFWSLIDEASYTTKPTLANLRFNYIDAEHVAAGNTITEGNLVAQRWNPTSSCWCGLMFGAKGAGDFVDLGAGALATTNLFRWWTLSSSNSPLPVTWLDLSSDCDDGNIIVKWSTASEQSADYFTLERSIDGNNFSSVATVQAAGNSSTTQYYSAVDADAYSGTSYYRVKETDFNGSYIYSSTITVNGCSSDISMAVYPNPSLGSFNVAVAGGKDDEVIIVVVDMLGQVFYSNVSVLSTDNEIIAVDPAHQLAAGVYTVIATSKDEILKKKIVIQ